MKPGSILRARGRTLMKIFRKTLWMTAVILSGYAVAWTFGLILGFLFLFFLATGRLKVHGYWNLVFSVLRGRLMIFPNHPTLLFETFGIPMLLFPWYLIVPWCFLWSMPDRRLLDLWKLPTWIRIALRCISVDRTSRMARGRGRMHANKVLRSGFVIVAHPESGRTFGEANRNKLPLNCCGRVMQKIESNLVEVALETNAWILPVWVDVPYWKPVSIVTSFRRMFGTCNARYRPVTISFERPRYKETMPFVLSRANERLQKEIFRA